MRLNITAIDTLAGTVSVGGDYTIPFTAGVKFLLFNNTFNAPSTGTDGLWTVVSAVVNGTGTDITVAETIPPTLTVSHLVTSIYKINLSDPTSSPIFIHPETVDGPGQLQQSTSLTLNGKGTLNYGENLLKNMIHIMEHFASAVAPSYPTIGQIWFDTSASQFNFWDGAVWGPLVVIPPAPPTPDEFYDFMASTNGSPGISQTVCRFVSGRTCLIDFAPEAGENCAALAEVPATASTVFEVMLNNVQIGTLTYAPGDFIGTFSGAGATCYPGDKLTVVAPVVPDATLADLTITIGGKIVMGV